MKGEKKAKTDRIKAKIADLEGLIAKWAHANDPESKWMLYLVREALDMGRLCLAKFERDA